MASCRWAPARTAPGTGGIAPVTPARTCWRRCATWSGPATQARHDHAAGQGAHVEPGRHRGRGRTDPAGAGRSCGRAELPWSRAGRPAIPRPEARRLSPGWGEVVPSRRNHRPWRDHVCRAIRARRVLPLSAEASSSEGRASLSTSLP